jgi:hypothetical protein
MHLNLLGTQFHLQSSTFKSSPYHPLTGDAGGTIPLHQTHVSGSSLLWTEFLLQFLLGVHFQLGTSVRVLMINLLVHGSPQVTVRGQVQTTCKPYTPAHHMIFTEIHKQVSQCSLGCVGCSTILLKKAILSTHPLSAGHTINPVFTYIHQC